MSKGSLTSLGKKVAVLALLVSAIAHARPDGGVVDEPEGLKCLCRNYALKAVQRDGAWVGALADGGVIPWDDGKTKTFEQKLETPDLEDTLSQHYDHGPISPVTTPDQDPGRIRVDALFRSTYGDTREAVERQLVPFEFFGATLRVHSRAAPAFRRAKELLDEAVNDDPSLKKFLTSSGGTFEWRAIAGTDRTSAHAYGVSIDINVKRSNYWRWDKKTPQWKNQIPQDIVTAFERAGFIWGGRWYHYDTMHFEWRPELFDHDCR